MKKLLALFIVVALLILEVYQDKSSPLSGDLSGTFAIETADQTNDSLQRAYQSGQSNVQVRGVAIVLKVLRDDLKGSRHQKFIIKSGAEQTVLVAHNIDLAPRIDDLKKGDGVEYYGEYEWDSRGGIIHWTHKDPKGYHIAGWLKHKGITYQ